MTDGAPPRPSFQDRFAALQRDWQSQLPGKLREAQERLDACSATPQDEAGLEALHRLLHTLAGSAGTFGLAELGVQARAVEHELDGLRARPQRNASDFDAARAQLRELVARAPQA